MRILVTGISGYIGSRLVPRLLADGHEVVGLSRRPDLGGLVPVVRGDAVAGHGLEQAFEGVDAAYFLIHSMEPSRDGPFAVREHVAAENFAPAARGRHRADRLSGRPDPGRRAGIAHLASRLAVEGILLGASPCAMAFRASIVIGAGSSSFRFLVRLVERMPVMAVPAWRTTAPVRSTSAT